MSQPSPHAPSHVRALDHVRALSAFAVVVHHVEQAKALLGLPGLWLAPWVQSLGTGGVDVFFGLSGYVITQSLLRAGGRPAGPLLRHFYTRRALRILPLYLALVFVAFGPVTRLLAGLDHWIGGVLAPAVAARDSAYGTLLTLHLLGLPNAALVAYPGVPFATHLWSVGAEMQFYLVWPLFFVLTRRVWTAAAIATAVTLLVEAGLRGGADGAPAPWVQVAAQTLGTIHARYLLAGITAAAFVAGPGEAWRARVPSHVLRGVSLVTIVALLPGRHLLPFSPWLSPLVLAMALAGLALAAPAAPTRATALADHLGRISYSIYVWHVLVIGVVAVALNRTLGLQPWGPGPHLALYLGVMAATIAAASLSFRVIEAPFLRRAARRR